MPDNAYRLARRRIDNAARRNQTSLDLHGKNLTELPPAIGQLTALKTLDLSGNKLAVLPPEIGQLSSLTEIDLSDNFITSLPLEFWQLTHYAS